MNEILYSSKSLKDLMNKVRKCIKENNKYFLEKCILRICSPVPFQIQAILIFTDEWNANKETEFETIGFETYEELRKNIKQIIK